MLMHMRISVLFTIYPNTIEWGLDTIKHEEGNCYLYENVDMLKPEMKQ